MAFQDLGDLIAGMASGRYRVPLQKANLASQVAGHECSLWRSAGFPSQGAIPTSAAICDGSTVGGLPLAFRTAAQQRIITGLSLQGPNIGASLMVEDRLAHRGGLSGILTSVQTVGMDLSLGSSGLAGGSTSFAARIGASDHSEVEWYLEWYTATGSTATTPTVNVTYSDGTTGSAEVWVLGASALPGNVNVGRRYKIVSTTGKFIRSVDSLQLSATTGTAGNFGVTAVRRLCDFEIMAANVLQVRDWSILTAPQIFDDSCISLAVSCVTTSSGALQGSITQAVN